MNPQNQSGLDNEPLYSKVRELILEGEFNTSIAAKLRDENGYETSVDSIRRFRKRHGLGIPTREKASVKIEGDGATVVTPVSAYTDIETNISIGSSAIGVEAYLNPDGDTNTNVWDQKEEHKDTFSDRLNDPDAMLQERGLDPEEWTIEGITVNEWDGPTSEGTTVTYKQAKLNLKRKKPETGLLPARSEGWIPSRISEPPSFDSVPKIIVLVGDQQAPFHDRRLHDLFLDWIEWNQPDEGVLIGDTVDFPDVSRHRNNPENDATANDCIQAGYEILRDYVAASPVTKWTKLIGNHDERIRNFVIDNAGPLYGLKRATRDYVEKEERVLDIEYLLRLDELQIKLVDPKGGYAQAQVNIDDSLAIRHGWLTRRGSGASALASLESVGYNIVVGHTHRQSIVQKTSHDINNVPTTLFGVEAGCMCSIDGSQVDGRRFPDYTTNPDWQQGFAVATVYLDGSTTIDLATYRNGSLFYRDQRFS